MFSRGVRAVPTIWIISLWSARSVTPRREKMDLLEWYFTVREEWPPINVLIHYLKNIYLYSMDNGLMEKHAEEMDSMDLPFNWRYIPLDYPQPIDYWSEKFEQENTRNNGQQG